MIIFETSCNPPTPNFKGFFTWTEGIYIYSNIQIIWIIDI